MSKRRLKFSKMGMAKYISHLDLLRCFTRAIMRSGLPVEYSQGFNPHQKITFALPLPVGVTSECEFVDISFGETVDEEILSKLNLNLPPDIRILSVDNILHKAAEITCAEYLIKLYPTQKIDSRLIDKFFGQAEVVVMKKTKKKTEKPINIMEYVRAFEIVSNTEREMELRVVLDAGGERNLKPDVLIENLCKELLGVRADDAQIHRKRVFCRKDDNTLEEFC